MREIRLENRQGGVAALFTDGRSATEGYLIPAQRTANVAFRESRTCVFCNRPLQNGEWVVRIRREESRMDNVPVHAACADVVERGERTALPEYQEAIPPYPLFSTMHVPFIPEEAGDPPLDIPDAHRRLAALRALFSNLPRGVEGQANDAPTRARWANINRLTDELDNYVRFTRRPAADYPAFDEKGWALRAEDAEMILDHMAAARLQRNDYMFPVWIYQTKDGAWAASDEGKYVPKGVTYYKYTPQPARGNPDLAEFFPTRDTSHMFRVKPLGTNNQPVFLSMDDALSHAAEKAAKGVRVNSVPVMGHSMATGVVVAYVVRPPTRWEVNPAHPLYDPNQQYWVVVEHENTTIPSGPFVVCAGAFLQDGKIALTEEEGNKIFWSK